MLLSLLLALATTEPSVPAATQAPMPAVASAQKVEDADVMVCRKELVTGSRFPTKVCRRKGDMAQKQQDDQDRLRQTQRPSGALTR